MRVSILSILLVASAAHASNPEREREPRTEAEQTLSDGQRAPVDLAPRLTLAESVGWILPRSPVPEALERRSERAADERLWRHLQRDRLANEGTDGWYYEVARSIRAAITIDMKSAIGERRRGMNVLQRVRDELGRYASGPVDPGSPPGSPTPETLFPFDPVRQQEESVNRMMSCLAAPVTWHRVEVRLTHAPDGELHGAWITQSTHNDVMDEAILSAVYRGIHQVRPPPVEIVGERGGIVSEWAFELGDVAPSGMCVLFEGDADPGPPIVRTRFFLLELIDETHPPFER